MKEQQIRFTEFNVSTDKSALETLRNRRLMQLPVLEINEEFYTSNSLEELKKIIRESTNV